MIKKMYNPGAYRDNSIVIHESDSGCNTCPERAICQYKTAPLASINATAVVIKDDNGNDVTYTFAAAATDRKALRAALLDALYEAGYDEADGNGIIFSGPANGTVVEVVGEAVIVSITNGGNPVNLTQCCERVVVCDYILNGVTAIDTITFNGDTTALSEDAVSYAEDSADDAFDAIEDTIGEESDVLSISVIDDEPNLAWNVVIHGVKGMNILINGQVVQELNCRPNFVCQAD